MSAGILLASAAGLLTPAGFPRRSPCAVVSRSILVPAAALP